MTPFSLSTETDTTHLSLQGELTIAHARALHTALLESHAPARALHFDPSGLTHIDTAALQILLATAFSCSRPIRTQTSTAWDNALLRHGLTDPFQPS